MTNFEYYKDEILKELNNGHTFRCSICRIKHRIKEYNVCDGIKCDKTGLFNWGLEENKEPIKLKQWEYDTIKYHGKLSKFNDIHFLMAMKNKGYFKDMNSVEKCSMTIKEILENCEIVSDDYEGFEDCK